MSYDRISQVHNLLISRSEVLGALACWAVQQSPYTVPEQLAEAVEKFHADWPIGTTLADDAKFSYSRFESLQVLEAQINATIALNPFILSWNSRKNGRDGMGFSSLFDKPPPDDDFIDLGALSRNMAMQVWSKAVSADGFYRNFTDPVTGRSTSQPQPSTTSEGSSNVPT